jgi:hypothetical protein
MMVTNPKKMIQGTKLTSAVLMINCYHFDGCSDSGVMMVVVVSNNHSLLVLLPVPHQNNLLVC